MYFQRLEDLRVDADLTQEQAGGLPPLRKGNPRAARLGAY